MKVLIVGPAPPLRGGIAKHTLGLSNALEQRGHHVEVVSYSRLYPRIGFPGRSEREDASPLGSPLLDTLSPVTWLRARRHVARKSADLVVLQWWHPVAAPALRSLIPGATSRIVLICHNLRPHDAFPGARALAASVLRHSDFVLCHSRALRDDVVRCVPGVECECAPMPMLLRPPSNLRSMRPSSHPSALFLGYVRPYKGVDVLLRAWKQASLPPSATLTVAGESYLGTGRLEALAAACRGRGVLIENRYLSDQEMWERLYRARVLVLPYRGGTQSGLLPLGLAAGARVIVSAVGGLAEPVIGDPRHEVVPPGDADLLARSLERTLRGVAGEDEDVNDRAGDALRQPVERAADAVQNSWLPTLEVLERVAGRRSH